MKTKTVSILLCVVMVCIVGCTASPTSVQPAAEPGMPNPASVYCEEQGGRLEIRTDDDGGEYGVCIFPDGSECEEWAYFRNECMPGDSLVTPAGQSSRPSDPVGARDAVLAYITENYGSEAPTTGLVWTEKHTKPEGLVGGESYEYTAGDWLIVVSYPVVAPESVVYTIVVSNQTTGFRLESQVDAQGQVTETSSRLL